MALKILLIISVLLQMAAAVIAIKLTRVTKFNFSWVLITTALILMTFMRIGEFTRIFMGKDLRIPVDVMVWIGIMTSLCFALGVFFIQHIIKYISAMSRKERIGQEQILNTVIKTEENERKRFSKDIHDGLGPLLSSAKLSVSALANTPMNEQQKAIIDNTNLVIDEAIRSLKEISNNINPHILNNFGLERAVSSFIKKLPTTDNLKITFYNNIKEIRFAENVEVALYRIVCELINNTIKHADAKKIAISITVTDNVLEMNYHDNGHGFSVEKLETMNSEGMGMRNIASRIQSLKGTINVESSKIKGTTIIIKLSEKLWA